MKVYISKDNQQFGPYSLDELRKYVQEGRISPDDYACPVGDADWISVSQLLSQSSPSNKNKASPPRKEIIDRSKIQPPKRAQLVDMDKFLESAKIKLNEIYINEKGHETLFLGTDIPSDKLSEAWDFTTILLGSVAVVGYAAQAKKRGELPLALLDNTVTGNGSEGLLLTDRGVYIRNETTKSESFAYNEIRSVKAGKKLFLNTLIVNDKETLVAVVSKAGKIMHFICSLIRYISANNVESVTNFYTKKRTQYSPKCNVSNETRMENLRHFIKLENVLLDEEIVTSVTFGSYSLIFGGSKKEVIASTSKRLLIVSEASFEEFKWNTIISCQMIQKGILKLDVLEIKIKVDENIAERSIFRMLEMTSTGEAVIHINKALDSVANMKFIAACGQHMPKGDTTSSKPSEGDGLDKLEKLYSLFEKGALTEEEYLAEKSRILQRE